MWCNCDAECKPERHLMKWMVGASKLGFAISYFLFELAK